MTDRSLTKDERYIYGLIKHYSNKRPISELGELTNFLELKLRTNQNFTRIKIEKIIKNLIKSKHILIGSRLVKENILNVPIRKEIYNYIRKNPGININEIKRKLNIGSNQIFWHLKILDNFEFIKSSKIKNQNALFIFGFKKELEEVAFYLRNEKIKDILSFLENNSKNPIRPTKISESLEIHYTTLKKYIQILLKYKIIQMVNGNKKKRYQLNFKQYHYIKNELKE